jgi:hypothetical protein
MILSSVVTLFGHLPGCMCKTWARAKTEHALYPAVSRNPTPGCDAHARSTMNSRTVLPSAIGLGSSGPFTCFFDENVRFIDGSCCEPAYCRSYVYPSRKTIHIHRDLNCLSFHSIEANRLERIQQDHRLLMQAPISCRVVKALTLHSLPSTDASSSYK